MREAQKATELAQEAATEARLEATDAMASFAGGGDAVDMVNITELEKVRDELDEAQSEVVTLRDTIEELTEEAKVTSQVGDMCVCVCVWGGSSPDVSRLRR